MKFLGEILAVLLVAFLFAGEPDVWDRLHAQAMAMDCAKGLK